MKAKQRLKRALALIVQIAGNLLALYIGIYWLVIANIIRLAGHFSAGDVTAGQIVFSVFQLAIALTVHGFIWVACDILATQIRRED